MPMRSVSNLLRYLQVNVPLFKNLSDPEGSFGLNCTRVLYRETEDGMRLGFWHVLPGSRVKECNPSDPLKIDPTVAFSDERPVVFYLHGNGGVCSSYSFCFLCFCFGISFCCFDKYELPDFAFPVSLCLCYRLDRQEEGLIERNCTKCSPTRI